MYTDVSDIQHDYDELRRLLYVMSDLPIAELDDESYGIVTGAIAQLKSRLEVLDKECVRLETEAIA